MLKCYNISENEAFANCTDLDAIKFFEWAMSDGAYLNRQFVTHSDYLSLCRMDGTYEVPPNMAFIGQKSAGRLAFGDEWADNFSINRRSPITNLESVTAPGYMRSLEHGFSFDLIEYNDGSTRGIYKTVKIPIRVRPRTKPVMIGMFAFFESFERI